MNSLQIVQDFDTYDFGGSDDSDNFSESQRESPYLSDHNERDSCWDKRRILADRVVALYQEAGESALAEKIAGCSQVLVFKNKDDGLKLNHTWLCRSIFCPLCQPRLAAKRRAKLFQILPKFLDDNQDFPLLFLTLTIKSIKINHLRKTLIHMNESWEKLMAYKAFRFFAGTLRSTEITRAFDVSYNSKKIGLLSSSKIAKWKWNNRGYNPDLLEIKATPWVHPHFHCLLIAPSDYFNDDSSNYISQPEFVKLWRRAAKLKYKPIVDIRRVKIDEIEQSVPFTLNEFESLDNEIQDDSDWISALLSAPGLPEEDTQEKPEALVPIPSQAVKAVLELCKYFCKPQQILGQEVNSSSRFTNSQWLKISTQQLKSMRLFNSSGIFRYYLREGAEEYANLIKIRDSQDIESPADYSPKVYYNWDKTDNRYRLRD